MVALRIGKLEAPYKDSVPTTDWWPDCAAAPVLMGRIELEIGIYRIVREIGPMGTHVLAARFSSRRLWGASSGGRKTDVKTVRLSEQTCARSDRRGQTGRANEFAAQIYCVIKGVVF
ncbi:MAG: hypothetical protein C0485_19170 [Pirellula sp.]|nr:hypothetical protein [Pirellula sp.]